MNTPVPPGPRSPAPGQDFFAAIASTGLVRAPKAPIAGVCGAIAQRYGLDTTLVRVLTVALAVFVSGISVPLLYGMAWLLLPDEGGRSHLQRAWQGREVTSGLVGSCLLILVSLPGDPTRWSNQGSGSWGGLVAMVVAAAAVVYYIYSRRDTHGGSTMRRRAVPPGTPAPPRVSLRKSDDEATPAPAPAPDSAATPAPASAPDSTAAPAASSIQPGMSVQAGTTGPPPPPLESRPLDSAPVPLTKSQMAHVTSRRGPNIVATLVALGLAALIGGAVWAVMSISLDSGNAAVYGYGSAALVLGLVTVVNGLRGRRGGIPAVVGVVALATSLVHANPYDLDYSSVEDKTVPVTTLASTEYPVGIGNLTLDLSGATCEQSCPAKLVVRGGLGDVFVKAPPGLALDVTATSRPGALNDLEPGQTKRFGRDGGAPDATLLIQGGLGDVTIEEIP